MKTFLDIVLSDWFTIASHLICATGAVFLWASYSNRRRRHQNFVSAARAVKELLATARELKTAKPLTTRLEVCHTILKDAFLVHDGEAC